MALICHFRDQLTASFAQRDLAKAALARGDEAGYGRHLSASLAASARFEQISVLQRHYDDVQPAGMSLSGAIALFNALMPNWLDQYVTLVVVGGKPHRFQGTDIGDWRQRMPFVDDIARSVIGLHQRDPMQVLRETQGITARTWRQDDINAMRLRHGIRN